MAALTDAPNGTPMKGTLRRTPFPRILRQLARSNATGSLFLLAEKTKKVVFFERGLPVFVRSNLVSECLGKILVSDGLISAKQCEQTLETMRRTGKQQGRLLVEMGLISEGNLRYGLEAQIRQKLFDIFAWPDGRYQFKTESPKQDFGVQLHLSSAAVILSGILERIDDETAKSQLEEVYDHYPMRVGNEPLDLELQTNERYLLESLDGSRTVKALLDAQFDPPVPMPTVLLHALIQSGLCQLSRLPRPARKAPPPPPDPNDIPDRELVPAFAATTSITEFEDTPLPGILRKSETRANAEQSMLLNDNAKSLVDETLSDIDGSHEDLSLAFGEEILQLGDDELELIEDGQTPVPGGKSTPSDLFRRQVPTSAMIDPNDAASLDEIDIEIDDLSLDALPPEQEQSGEGTQHYNRGVRAMNVSDWKTAIEQLELAYECEVDVAELHAMLAYARFKFSGEDSSLAEHALELLAYAEDMNPRLDLVHAYRGAVLFAEGDTSSARSSVDRALEINPANPIALDLRGRL